ncbi:MAG: antibiotic biosynthesis monooxygenase [Deltaproteobacteria bacterium]|jgi:heme-degrading monooxygenase HmoA|nr:antibiotic biosynthesis monooxygenase [Deltaproteobacteria bacterium]
MYAVIFKAEINVLDDAYIKMATRMRDLAINKYGCIEFTAVSEENQEVAISYWHNQGQIKAWKNDPEHQQAQELGKTKWYKSYQVQIAEIIRSY